MQIIRLPFIVFLIVLSTLTSFAQASRHLHRQVDGTPKTDLTLMSINGGGMRGIIPGIIAEHIRADLGIEHLYENVDFFGGVSTGSIISTGLALGIPAAEIQDIYHEWGPRIFEKSLLRSLCSPKQELYHHGGLEAALQHHFGDKTVGDLKSDMIALAYDIEGNATRKPGPVLYNSGLEAQQEIPLWTIPRASCSAPTIFQPYYGVPDHSLVDGGFVANNPTETAISQILSLYDDQSVRQVRDSIRIVCLGTGRYRQSLDRSNSSCMGFLDWAPRLPSLMADGAMDLQVMNLQNTYRKNFVYIDPPLDREIGLDSTDPTDLEYLRDATHRYLDTDEGRTQVKKAVLLLRSPTYLTDVD